MVQNKYSTAEAMYARIKEEVCQRALALDEAVSQSTQVRWGVNEPSLLIAGPWGSHMLRNAGFILPVAIVKPFIRHDVVILLQGSFLAVKAGEKVFES